MAGKFVQDLLFKDEGGHKCVLPQVSDSCLPIMQTYDDRYEKVLREIKKRYLILDHNHWKAKKIFRSHFAIMTERLKHVKEQGFFVIHPFSKLALFREHLCTFIWLLAFFIDPYIVSFRYILPDDFIFFTIQFCIDVILAVNILMEFSIGFFDSTKRETELNSNKIRSNYLKSYFIFDFIGVLPHDKIVHFFVSPIIRTKVIYIITLKLIRIVRIRTMVLCFRDLLARFQVVEHVVQWIIIFFLNILILHWLACILHGFTIFYYLGAQDLPSSSWLILMELYRKKDHDSAGYIYLHSLFVASSHFYGATEGDHKFENDYDCTLASLCMIIGFLYCTYSIAYFLQFFIATKFSRDKYDELLYQLNQYSKTKLLPEVLQKRLKTYYQYKFQRNFFNEETIMATLSKNLRAEICYFRCKQMIEKGVAFKDENKVIVGKLMANFKIEVYLQNDVILKHGDIPQKIYFIANGTVAVYLADGEELMHREDGDFFGHLKGVNQYTIIAAEITEFYTLDMKDVRPIFRQEKEAGKRIKQALNAQIEEYEAVAKTIKELKNKSVVTDLRRGFILEKRKLRDN